MKSINLLKIILWIDAIIALLFGIVSWILPHETYGTIVSIPETHSSVFLALLSSLSLFYILIGLTCLIGAKSAYPTSIWIGILMITRHLFEGILKMGDIGKDWLIGNPYPDLIIHAVFILLYFLGVFFSYRRKV